MDAMDLEASQEKYGAVAENQKVPKEEAVGRRRKRKKRTEGDGGSWQKLTATRGRLNRRAVPATRKGHGRQGPGKDDVVRGIPKGRMFDKRRRALTERSKA
jgi:hypothetical protein